MSLLIVSEGEGRINCRLIDIESNDLLAFSPYSIFFFREQFPIISLLIEQYLNEDSNCFELLNFYDFS